MEYACSVQTVRWCNYLAVCAGTYICSSGGRNEATEKWPVNSLDGLYVCESGVIKDMFTKL